MGRSAIRVSGRWGAILLALLPMGVMADAWQNALVTRARPSDSGNRAADVPAFVSGDGRYAVFSSGATDIVPEQVDGNFGSDVFLHDRTTGDVVLVSRANGSATKTGNDASVPTAISADGRYVLFHSGASDFVAGAPGVADPNDANDVFVFDREAGIVSLVSHPAGNTAVTANGSSLSSAITPDGRWVVYTSTASDTVAGLVDTNGVRDVFLYDRTTNLAVLVTSNAVKTDTANGEAQSRAVTPDGRYVLYTTPATDVVTGLVDTNTASDVYRFDRTSGAARLVSGVSASPTVTGNGAAQAVGISDDGRYVAFHATSTSVVPGQIDTNNANDVFIVDLTLGSVRLASGASGSPSATADGASTGVALSSNGQVFYFNSAASNLVGGQADTNGAGLDAFLFDRITANVQLVLAQDGSTTITANAPTPVRSASADGRYAAIETNATNVLGGTIDPHGVADIYVADRVTGARTLASHTAASLATAATGASQAPVFSADGSVVVFSSVAANLVAGFVDLTAADVFSWSRGDNANVWVSRARGSDSSEGGSMVAGVSDDARYVAYSTTGTDLLAGVNDANGALADAYVLDRDTGTQQLVSHSATSPTTAVGGSALQVSADGLTVLFSSTATNVVSGVSDANGVADLFLFDVNFGNSILVSRRAGTATTLSTTPTNVTLSANGQYVVFASQAGNVVLGQSDTNGARDVFLYDRTLDTLTLVSRAAGTTTTTANAESLPRAISANGRYVVFSTNATNLQAGVTDSNGQVDAYLFDRTTGSSVLVSHAAGSPTTAAGGSVPMGVSDDGAWVTLQAVATNLQAGVTDANGTVDGYLCNTGTGDCTLLTSSAASALQTANGLGIPERISPDGRWIVVSSEATDVIAGVTDANGGTDLYLHDRVGGTRQLVSHAASGPASTGSAAATVRSLAADGSRVLYASASDAVVPMGVDANAASDLFAWDRATDTASFVSHSVSGLRTASASGASIGHMTPDGGAVAYHSSSGDIVVSDNNSLPDIFLAARRFVVTPVAGSGGSIVPGGAVAVVPGQATLFNAVPQQYFGVQGVSGCGGSLAGTSFTTGAIVADCTVTASFVRTQFVLQYAAGANGSLTGTTMQVVAAGGSGTAVTAVPAVNYHFLQWSDASTANPRVDAGVAADLDVTAVFEIDDPLFANGFE